ncbi:MAG: hypothetical protein ACO1SV_03520 [Fimbriimonas sp.]
MLTFPFTDRVPEIDELAEGGWELATDIGGKPGEVPYRVWLGRTADEIWMAVRAEKPAFCHRSVAPGAWHFGLWHFDCAELFLLCSATGRYLEVNLAPNGAYWAGAFVRARHRDESVDARAWGVKTTGEIAAERWAATIAMPWAAVVEALGGEPDRGNVTAILGGCPDEDVPPENLRSVVPMNPAAPDFHVPDRYVPLSW